MKKLFSLFIVLLLSLTIISCDKTDGKAKHYNFYNIVSTLPTTYSVLNTHADESESYVLFARRGTFSGESLGKNATLIETDVVLNNEYKMDIVQVANKITKLYEENKKSTFTFFVDDLNVQYFLDAIIAPGIPYEQVKLVIITDGTATYNQFSAEIANKTDDELKATIAEVKENYDRLFTEYELGKTLVGYENGDRTPATYVKDGTTYNAIKNYLSTMVVAQATKGFDVEWWMQYPECLEGYINKDERPNLYAEFKNANIKKIQPVELYEKLSETAKVDFLNSSLSAQFKNDIRMGLTVDYAEDGKTIIGYHNDVSPAAENTNTIPYTKSYLDDIIYGKENELPILIFSGGSANAMGMTGERGSNFEKTVQTIANYYKDSYKIVFKPHPNYIPNGVDLQILIDNGITTLLPGRLPMELLLYSYPGVKVGGYNSSLYMSANPSDVMFFVGGLSGSVAFCFDKVTNPHINWFNNPASLDDLK